jgi:hypothetical protein
MWLTDLDLDEPLTFDVVAETIGARRSLVARLAHQGLIETLENETGEVCYQGALSFNCAGCSGSGVTWALTSQGRQSSSIWLGGSRS